MVVKGILESMADGIGNYANISRRYIKIASKRIGKITTGRYIDNVLSDNLGNEVEISYRKMFLLGNYIYAIKESDGEITKYPLPLLIVAKFFLRFFFAGFIAVLTNIFMEDDFILPCIGIGVIFVIATIISIIKDIKTSNALD